MYYFAIISLHISRRSRIALKNKESEEHLKNIANDFLKDNFYPQPKYEINGLIVRVGVNTDTEGGLKNETVDHKHTAGGADCLSIK